MVLSVFNIKMNLIYACVFHQRNYINLLKLLMLSISKRGNINKDSTHILIITSPEFAPIIHTEISSFDLPKVDYYTIDLHSLFEAGCARLNIFKYTNIQNYEKILYLDTDILINSDVNVLFRLELDDDKLYALEEGTIEHEFWGGQFFDFNIFDKNTPAFTSGVLFFRNSHSIKSLFDDITMHIENYVAQRKPLPTCLDQPFIVYHAISQNKSNVKLLQEYMENNPSSASVHKIIYHFPGGPGSYQSKLHKMINFWEKNLKHRFI